MYGLLIFSVLLIFSCAQNEEIVIGAIFGPGLTSGNMEALKLAVEYVNGNRTILPNHTIVLRINITNNSSFSLIKQSCQSAGSGISLLIGPNQSSYLKRTMAIPQGIHLPQITPFATDPTLSVDNDDYPYLFKASSPDGYQSNVLEDIAWRFGWTRFSIIASQDDYGRNGVQDFMQQAASHDWIVSSADYFNPATGLTQEAIRKILRGIKAKGARIVILNCYASQSKIILEQAARLAMLNTGWAWLATDATTATSGLFNSCAEVPLHVQGLLGTRPSYGKGELFTQFHALWEDRMAAGEFEVGQDCAEETESESCADVCNSLHFNILDMRLVDSVLIAAYALHAYLKDGHNLDLLYDDEGVCQPGPTTPWSNGARLRDYLRKVDGPGVMNHLNFTDNQYSGVNSYEIVNLIENGWVPVGNWSPVQNITQQPNLYLDNNRLYLYENTNIIFPGGGTDVPKDTFIDMTNITLKVVTLIEPPFIEYTTDEERKWAPDKLFKGLCVDLLNNLKGSLGFEYEMYVVADGAYGNENAQTKVWNGLMGDLIQGEADMCMAPLTITYERQQFVKFTKPFMDLGVTILAAKAAGNPNIVSFLEPFEWSLWAVVIAVCIFVGICFTMFSHCSPFGHRGSYTQREEVTDLSGMGTRDQLCLRDSIWLSYAAWMQQGAEFAPKSLSGRFAQGIWWFTVMVISATYTANLAAFLTVARLDSGINSLKDLANQREIAYGTVKNSAVQKFFETQVSDPYVKMASYMSQEQTNVENATYGIDLVRNADAHDEYAFIFDSTILDYTASNRPCTTRIASELFNQFGYGIAFPKNSPFVDLFSLQVLKLRENGTMEALKNRWVSSGSCLVEEEAASATSDKVSLMNMAGVFAFLAGGLAIAVFLMMVEFCIASHREGKNEQKRGTCPAMQRRLKAICEDLQRICSCAHGVEDSPPQTPTARPTDGHQNRAYNNTEIYLGDFIMKRPQINGDAVLH